MWRDAKVTDAPEAYVPGQVNGVVGIELTDTGVVGTARLSQNRSAADQAGAIDGLGHVNYADANAVPSAMALARSRAQSNDLRPAPGNELPGGQVVAARLR